MCSGCFQTGKRGLGGKVHVSLLIDALMRPRINHNDIIPQELSSRNFPVGARRVL